MKTLNCVLLKDNNRVLVAKSDPEINSRKVTWRPRRVCAHQFKNHCPNINQFLAEFPPGYAQHRRTVLNGRFRILPEGGGLPYRKHLIMKQREASGQLG